jgi:hypothetical protein
VLRRQIQDVPEVQWSDAELNDVLDLTYSLIQKEIIKSFPDAHLFWDTINTVAGTSGIPFPRPSGSHRSGSRAPPPIPPSPISGESDTETSSPS